MYLCILPIQTSPPTPFISVITSNKLLLKASAHGLGRFPATTKEMWWGRRQSQRAPSSLFVEHWRSKMRFPWNNDSLQSAIKGAEPRENSRRLNRHFLGYSKVWHTHTAGAGQRLPHLRSLGAGAEEMQVGHQAGSQGHLSTSPGLGTAGTEFGTEGLSRVKLLIKQMLGLWLWELLVTELALQQKPGKSKRLVGISLLPFSPTAVCSCRKDVFHPLEDSALVEMSRNCH